MLKDTLTSIFFFQIKTIINDNNHKSLISPKQVIFIVVGIYQLQVLPLMESPEMKYQKESQTKG